MTQTTWPTFEANASRVGLLLCGVNEMVEVISAGFGTSPSIVNSNGTSAFTVNVGTGGVATSGTVGMPAATTGWACSVTDVTNPDDSNTVQTGGTTTTVIVKNYSRTTGAAAAWAASDVLRLSCMAY